VLFCLILRALEVYSLGGIFGLYLRNRLQAPSLSNIWTGERPYSNKSTASGKTPALGKAPKLVEVPASGKAPKLGKAHVSAAGETPALAKTSASNKNSKIGEAPASTYTSPGPSPYYPTDTFVGRRVEKTPSQTKYKSNRKPHEQYVTRTRLLLTHIASCVHALKNAKRVKKSTPSFDIQQTHAERTTAYYEFMQILTAKLGGSCSLSQYKLAVEEFTTYRREAEMLERQSHYHLDLVKAGYKGNQLQKQLAKKMLTEQHYLTRLDKRFLNDIECDFQNTK